MTTWTDPSFNLKQETINTIQDLVQINLDSANGFEESAKEISDSNIAALFEKLSEKRREIAAELQLRVAFNGERPRPAGSWLGLLHQSWIKLRSLLSGGDPYAILCEAERGEEFIKQAYEDALQKVAGSVVADELAKHYGVVKAGHDRIVELRERYQPV